MRIGTLARLFRYPVKSMRGQELQRSPIGLQGVPGDRRYAFVQAGSRSYFPWLTARQLNQLLLYRTEYDEPFDGEGREPPLSVLTPDGCRFSVYDEALQCRLESLSEQKLYLLRDHRGNFDVGQISIFNLTVAGRLSRETGREVDPRRFRANLYVEPEQEPYDEQALPGRVLRIGDSLRIAITALDDRCLMVTLDPDDATSRPDVLRAVAGSLGNKAGLYGSVIRSGTVQLGDPVVLEEP